MFEKNVKHCFLPLKRDITLALLELLIMFTAEKKKH